MYRVITDEHLQYIKDHPEMTDVEIGEVFNINSSTIRSARHKLGILKDRIVNISKEEFLNTYKECNNKLYLTAEKLNVDRHTLRKIANKYGIKTSRSLNMSKEAIKDIQLNYNNCTAKELAKKHNCSISTVIKVWKIGGLFGKTNRVYNLDESYFDTINTSAKAYFVGFIASDGCLYATDKPNKSSIVKISIAVQDEKILKLFQSELRTNKPLSYHTSRGCSYVDIEVCSNKIVDDLVKIGLTPIRKTYGNTIPVISDDLMPHFIRGYFDGDGSIPTNWANNENHSFKPHADIAGFKKNMLKLIQYLENKNIYANFVHDKRNYNGDDEFGSLSLSNLTSVYCFLKLIYKDCGEYYLDRKKQSADNFIKYIENSNNIRHKQVVNYYKYAVQAMC